MFETATLQSTPSRSAAIERAWAQLTGAGAMLTGAQRIAIINAARSAWSGATEPNRQLGAMGEATHWLALDAEGITAELVAEFETRGLDRLSYLEIVGVVARLSNIDWYVRAIGAPRLAVPESDGAQPTGNVHPDARITDSWVPMLGDASAPMTLDALPDEGDALRDLHEPMYIDMSAIADWSLSDMLSRPQIEFVAARTSYLNECFY